MHDRLGEVLWRLGRVQDAVAAWREAVRCDVDALAPAQSLADALLALGDAAGARAVTEGILTRHPGDAHAELAQAVAMLLDANADHQAAIPRAMAVLARDPRLLDVRALAAAFAVALDRLPESPGKTALLEVAFQAARTSPTAATMPALLLSLLCEGGGSGDALSVNADGHAARAEPFALARGREFESDEHEALRRIANAAVRAAPDEVLALAQRYAVLCARSFAAAMPLVWPRRTAGRRLRVVVLATVAPDPEVRACLTALTGLAVDRFDVTVAVIGGQAAPDASAGIDASRRPRVVPLPAIPDANDAQRLAALDRDLLIDLAGLRAGAGLLLAQRPARAIVTRRRFSGAQRDAADRRRRHAGPRTRPMLDERWRALPPDGDVPDASGMAAIWDGCCAHAPAGRTGGGERALRPRARLQPGYAPAHYLLGITSAIAATTPALARSLAAAIAAAPALCRRQDRGGEGGAGRRATCRGRSRICADGLAATTQPLRAASRARARATCRPRRAGCGRRLSPRRSPSIPLDGETHYNHGVALQMQRRNAEAVRPTSARWHSRPDLDRGRVQSWRAVPGAGRHGGGDRRL